MGTVHFPKSPNHPGYINAQVWPGVGQHTRGRRVGVLGMHVQCEECGQVCTASHQPYVLTNPNWDSPLTVPGAWVGPPGDPLAHFYPMAPTEVPQTGGQDNIERQAETSQHPSQRPVSFTAAMQAASKANRRNRPSRTPEARRAERARAARRKALAALDG